MLSRLFRVSFLALLAISFVLSTVAQIPTPPTVTLIGSQGGHDGSQTDPFQSSGFSLTLDITDPDPTGYAYAGWRVVSSSFQNGAQYCPGGVRPGQFFGAEGPAPTFVHPRIQGPASARWRITVAVNVIEEPHPAVVGQTTFWVAPHPSGCTGTGPPPPPPDNRPVVNAFTTNMASARQGDTLTLSATAIDANDDTLTFFFYASSVSTAGVRGNLIATRSRGSCRDGCIQTFSLGMGNSTQWYSVEVSDGIDVASFGTKRRVEFLSGTAPVGPSPRSCSCANVQVQVDAGPPDAQILGGLPLEIPGTVAASVNGSTPVASAVDWEITDNAGLTGLSFNPVNQASTVLSTPDVSENRLVRLRLNADGGGCACSDTINVTLLADPPPEADLSVTQTDSADPITVGSQVVYSVTVSNAGPDDATAVQLNETIPSGMNFVTAVPDQGSCSQTGGLVSCDLATIPASSSVGIQVTFESQTAGAKSATVSVSSDVPDPSFGNNSATESTTVLTTSADLSLTKSAPVDPIPQHGEFDYILQVMNSGPDPATGVTVTDSLPAGISLVLATPTQGTCGTVSPVVCELGDLAVDASAQITIRVSAPLPGQPENTATVSGAEGDPDGTNNSDSASVVVTDAEADLTIDKVANPSPVGQGKELVYTITVVNDGPDPATAVTMTDELPDLMEFFSASASPGSCTEAAGTVTCDLGNLAVDEGAVVSITVIANADGLVENTAEVSAAQVDPDETNNSSTVGVSVLSPNFVVVPHSLGLDRTFVAMAVLNSIGGENPLTIQGLDADGQVTTEVDLENPIAALGQEAFLTRTHIDTANAILARGLLGPIQGFFMMGDETSPVRRLDGIGNRLEDDDRLFLPQARQTETDTTVIFLFNPDFEAPAHVSLALYDPSGSKVGSDVTMTLEASGSLLASVAELFGPETLVEDGYIYVTGDAPVRGFQVGVTPESFISIPAQRGTITKKLVAPHFFIGNEGRTTRVRFLNLNPSPARIRVTATDDDRGLLAEESPFFDLEPNSVQEVDLADLFDIDTSELDAFNFLQGFLEFDLQGGSVFPFEQQANVVANVIYDGGTLDTLSTLPIAVEGRPRSLYLHVAQSFSVGMFTGLAMLNQQTEPVEVTVEAFDKDGILSASRTLILEPRTRIVGLLTDPEFFGGLFEQIGGYIRVDGQVVSIALFGGQGFLSAIGGQEPLN